MKIEIHYTIDALEDYYILLGDTIEEIQEQNKIEMAKRNLDAERNSCWSKEIREV